MEIDELVTEIVSNARRDRKILEGVQDAIEKTSVQGTDPDSPELKVLMAEKISLISDSLARVQQTLVELAKIKSREKSRVAGKGDPQAEREGLYKEIEGSSDDLLEG